MFACGRTIGCLLDHEDTAVNSSWKSQIELKTRSLGVMKSSWTQHVVRDDLGLRLKLKDIATYFPLAFVVLMLPQG